VKGVLRLPTQTRKCFFAFYARKRRKTLKALKNQRLSCAAAWGLKEYFKRKARRETQGAPFAQ
ncbi:hypothetical protein, partial [Actibacterium atlanticum]|uniref:hypothetical protein n=1 Tax=Actibacterium atlanticum TaxID=1461693 RepID=UPI001EE23D47